MVLFKTNLATCRALRRFTDRLTNLVADRAIALPLALGVTVVLW